MITKNIGNIMLIILFIVYIYSLTSYICRGLNPLRNRLIEEGIKDENDEEKYLSTEGIKMKSKIVDDKGKNKKKKDKKRKSKNKHNPPKKKKNKKISVLERNKKKNKELRKLDKLETNVDNYKYPKRSINIIFNQRKDSNEDMLISQEPKKEEKATKKFSEKETKKDTYDDFELNEMEYEEAAKNDKRSLMRIYFSLLKRENKILFTFFVHNDYNLFYIKIWRFVFLIASDMAMNALFFTDETMHKLYLTYGKYDFVQQIPQIVYSTVISQIIEVFLCYLSLTDTPFYEIKRIKLSGKNIETIKKILKCINTKLVVFYILTLIFYIGFWYIIVIFCAVYENTQITYLKDCLFSFLLSIILPFFVYIIPACFRVCAIRDEKVSSSCLYKLSDIIPFF